MKLINKKAFTLSEILMALVIVGAIAALTIPSTMDKINSKILSSQLKNTIISIQQIIEDELISKKVKNLELTAFSNSAVLNNFLTTKSCEQNDNDDCWPTESAEHPAYQTLAFGGITKPTQASVVTKNGVSLAYEVVDEEGSKACYGAFWVDVNGVDKPNILGRDLFQFYVTKDGKMTDRYQCDELIETEEDPETEPETEPEEPSEEEPEEELTHEEQLLKDCKTGDVPSACFTLIQINNWKMNY